MNKHKHNEVQRRYLLKTLAVLSYFLNPKNSPVLWLINLIIFQVVNHLEVYGESKVEIYLVELTFAEKSNRDRVVKKKFSRSDTLGKIIVVVFYRRHSKNRLTFNLKHHHHR